jgi:hypothetical protein
MGMFALLALAGIVLAIVIMHPWDLDYGTDTGDYDSGWSIGDWFDGDGGD